MMSDFSWLPGWAFGCLAVVAVLFALALLCMPFAVFGTKPRLQDLEFQIAEMRAELRALNLRLAVSSRPDSLPAASDTEVVGGGDMRMAHPQTGLPDEDYLIPARSLPVGLPSYEDGPGQGDPETLPRRGQPSGSAVREERPDRSERAWTRAPWEQDQPSTARQPLGRSMDKRAINTSAVEENAYRPRSEPKLRWPPRS